MKRNENRINNLVDIYARFCERHSLPEMCAEELLYENLTPFQRRWVSRFILIWEKAEQFGRKDAA